MDAAKTINLGNVLLSLSEAVDLANTRIAQHQQRTAYIALEICKAADIDAELTKDVFIASLLHDTGAITVEEKISFHEFEEVDLTPHCVRGELLLNRIPEFQRIAAMVRHHHTEWRAWQEPLEVSQVLASQIILLADFVERAIDRTRYILHQTEEITERVKAIAGTMVHSVLVNHFLESSRREGFWLDLVSPRLIASLFHKGPLQDSEIDYTSLENISKLFRDLIDFKSRFTATHTSGVSACAAIISKLVALEEHTIQEMKIAGNLHDLGKLAIPNAILEKPAALTKDEFAIMKSHAYYSYHIINAIPGLEHIAEWAAFHHERLDGTGYPFHRDNRTLPLGSRIMAVADIFTAIAEDRPYRKRMEKDSIVKILRDMGAKKSVDPEIVDLLVDNYRTIDEHVMSNQAAAKAFYDARIGAAGELEWVTPALS